jgi:hypothetical protein
VERPWEQVHGPGTLDDLLKDARKAGYEISRRTIHDWISLGLLDNPQRRGAGRGSRPGLHSANQRKLFLLLLSKRVEMPKIPSLALVPFAIWMWWGEEWVPTRQALKAFRTWFGDGLRRKQVCLEAARATLEQIDHPAATDTARNRFVRLFAEVGYQGGTTPELRSELEEAGRAVFEPPSVFATSGLTRAVGPASMPWTLEMLLYRVDSITTAMLAVRDNKVDEELLIRSRALYLQFKREYENLRPGLAAQAVGPFVGLYREQNLDDYFNNIGTQMLDAIAMLLVSPIAQAQFPSRG